MENRKQSLITGIFISIFFAFTVLFYGPLSQYLPNAEELWFGLGDVLGIILPTSLVAVALAAVFFFIVPPEAAGFFLELFFGVSLALYVQGNYLRSNYGTGLMDGSEIDWSKYTAYGIFDIVLWVALIAAPFIAAWFLRDKKGMIAKVLIVASLFLTAVQIPALAVQAASYQPNENASLKISTKEMFEVSPKENIIYFILDGVDDRYYQTYLSNNPDFADVLEGFVHYDNTLSSGARTTIGVPSMLTGIPYHRQCPYTEYVTDIYNGKTSLSALHDHGYHLGVYSESQLFSVESSKFISNFSEKGREVGSYYILMKKLYKLDLFKFLPHFMKKYVWFDTQEFDSAKEQENTYKENDAAFFESFNETRFMVKEEKDKVFQLYHLYGAHSPFVLTKDAKRAEKKDGITREEQLEGVFKIVRTMLEDLKEKGLYNDATIVITADHGDKHIGEYPVLLVKRSGDTSEYSVSHAPASLFDMAIFLSELVGEELPDQKYGMRLEDLTEDMERERHMFRNKRGRDKGYVIQEYKTTARADERDKIEFVKQYEDPEDENTPYYLGTELSFTADATGNKYCLEGIGYNTGFRSRIFGPYAKFSFPIADLPSKGELVCRFDIRPTEKEWNTVIEANGTEVFNGLIDRQMIKEGLEFTVPVSVFKKDNVLKLDFTFTDVPEEDLEIEDIVKRTETLSLKSMVIEVKK